MTGNYQAIRYIRCYLVPIPTNMIFMDTSTPSNMHPSSLIGMLDVVVLEACSICMFLLVWGLDNVLSIGLNKITEIREGTKI